MRQRPRRTNGRVRAPGPLSGASPAEAGATIPQTVARDPSTVGAFEQSALALGGLDEDVFVLRLVVPGRQHCWPETTEG